MEEVKRGQPEAYEARGRISRIPALPAGKVSSDLAARTLPLLEEMSSLDGNVLVVGHSGCSASFWPRARRFGPPNLPAHQDTGGSMSSQVYGKSLSVERLNWKPSLQQAGTR
jgi:broad specificity phosphatase PhoE